MAIVGLRNLCGPAYTYLVISGIALIIMAFQNVGNVNMYCLGNYNCSVVNTTLIFLVKAVYIVFWTWVLNLICKAGATNIAWFLVLLPFILMFVFIATIMFT
jgi:hypothetical protein